LGSGDYERALDLFALAWKENPGHPGVGRDFPEALAGLKKSGDEAFQKGRLEEAGKRWALTLGNISHPAAKGKSISFGQKDLQGSLDRLSSTLMEKGLVEYRQGNIEAAISWWKTILTYDPNHAEAARSIRTASIQLENLKKIDRPK
jgi:tetratricopeptide (TPR) repeat protein